MSLYCVVRIAALVGESDENLVPMSKGLVNVHNGETLPFSPEVLITSKSPVAYVKESPCPAIRARCRRHRLGG